MKPRFDDDEAVSVTLGTDGEDVPVKSSSEKPPKKKKKHYINDENKPNARYILSGKRWIIFWTVAAAVIFQIYFGIFGLRIPYFISLYGNESVKSLHAGHMMLQTAFQRQGEINWWKGYLVGITTSFPIGAALAVAGASFQSLFKNPLASPDILGVTAGGSLGGGIYILATLGSAGNGVMDVVHKVQIGPIVFPLGMFQVVMFVSGLAAVGLVMLIATAIDRNFRSMTTLMLTGMAISATCNSVLTYIKAVLMPTDDTDIRTNLLSTLLYGNFGGSGVWTITAALVIFAPILIFLGFRLNAMTFGEEAAKGMGIRTNAIRIGVVVCSTFLVISVVSTLGPISWVGMVAPFIGRMLVGPDNKKLLPFSMLLGSLIVTVLGEAHSLHLPVISFFAGTSAITFFSVVMFFGFLIWSRKRGGSAWL